MYSWPSASVRTAPSPRTNVNGNGSWERIVRVCPPGRYRRASSCSRLLSGFRSENTRRSSTRSAAQSVATVLTSRLSHADGRNARSRGSSPGGPGDVEHDQREVRPGGGAGDRRDHREEP